MKLHNQIGKFLDQPRLLGYFQRSMPVVLIGGGALYGYHNVKKAPVEEQKKETIKNIAILSSTIAFSLVAPHLAAKIVKSFKKNPSHVHVHSNQATHAHGEEHLHHAKNPVHNHTESHCSCGGHHHEHGHNHGGDAEHVQENSHQHTHEHHEHQHVHEHEHEHGGWINLKELKEHTTKHIDEFLEHNKVSEKTKEYLEKAKTKILTPKQISTVYDELESTKAGKEFLSGEHGLIPDPEHIDSNHIFKGDLPRISIMGLFPVLGGIAGGILGDKLTDTKWKDKISDKVKEGSYQYLANIFLCNIGAGAALLAMEKAKRTSKVERAVAMVTGIILTGVVFGSAIANLIGKTVVEPLIDKKHNKKNEDGDKLFSERTPELLDLGLHVDDVATVAVLSGLKWIEPALPALYAISGYRAGIGYRNGEGHHQHHLPLMHPNKQES